MDRFLRDNVIKPVQTTTHAHTVERFIRTFKNNLYRRLDSLNGDNTKWIKHRYKHISKTIIQLSIALFQSSLMKLEKTPLGLLASSKCRQQ